MTDNQPVPTNKPQPKLWVADSVLLLTAVVWGINILVFKHVDSGNDLFSFNALRLILALTTLTVLSVIEVVVWPETRPKAPIPWSRIFLFSLLNGLLYLLLFVNAVPMTTAGNVALILASLPMWTALLSFGISEKDCRRSPGSAW